MNTGSSEQLYAWKFIVPSDQWYSPPGSTLSYKGFVCVAIGRTPEAARSYVERFCAENGLDTGWLTVAKVRQIPLVDGAVLAFAESG